MNLKNGLTRKIGASVAIGLASSVSLLGCSGASENAESSPKPTSSQSPSATAPTSTPSTDPTANAPSPTASAQPASPSASTSEQGEASVPPSFMAEVPRLNITTPEAAIEVLQEAFDYNQDLTYRAHLNEYGTFDVTVKSISLAAEGGTGTVGTYEVKQDGNYFLN